MQSNEPQSKPNTPKLLKTGSCGRHLLLTFAAFLLASGTAFSDGKKLAKELQNGQEGKTGKVDVIIQFCSQPTDSFHSKVSASGGKLKHKFDFIKSAHYSVPAAALGDLSNDPNICYISSDRSVGKSLDHVDMVTNADIGWGYGWKGTGIGVAVIDSGVDQVPDLNTSDQTASRIVYSQSFVSNDPSTGDLYGHGTHVAGIVGGNAFITAGHFSGIAPNVSIINLRVLDQHGSGSDSSVIAAINQAIALQSTYNIRVINLSLGRGVYESYSLDPLCQAVEAAWNAGIVVVVAAGNSGRNNSLGTHGYGTIGVPGNDPYVITVGAANMHEQYIQAAQTITSFSSKGPTLIDHFVKPDLAAPGNRVVSLLAPGSTIATTYQNFDLDWTSAGLVSSTSAGATLLRLSGTSMAAPAVSGAAALLLQQNPTLTPDQLKARLMKTAYKGYPQYTSAIDQFGTFYSLQHDIFVVGAGYLDIAAALSNNDLAPATVGSAESPQVMYDSAAHHGYLVALPGTVWNSGILWGDGIVWGDAIAGTDLVTARGILWGDAEIWGQSTTQGYAIIWGNGILWGDANFQALSDGDSGDVDTQ